MSNRESITDPIDAIFYAEKVYENYKTSHQREMSAGGRTRDAAAGPSAHESRRANRADAFQHAPSPSTMGEYVSELELEHRTVNQMRAYNILDGTMRPTPPASPLPSHISHLTRHAPKPPPKDTPQATGIHRKPVMPRQDESKYKDGAKPGPDASALAAALTACKTEGRSPAVLDVTKAQNHYRATPVAKTGDSDSRPGSGHNNDRPSRTGSSLSNRSFRTPKPSDSPASSSRKSSLSNSPLMSPILDIAKSIGDGIKKVAKGVHEDREERRAEFIKKQALKMKAEVEKRKATEAAAAAKRQEQIYGKGKAPAQQAAQTHTLGSAGSHDTTWSGFMTAANGAEHRPAHGNPIAAATKHVRNASNNAFAAIMKNNNNNESAFFFNDTAPPGMMEPCKNCGQAGSILVDGKCERPCQPNTDLQTAQQRQYYKPSASPQPVYINSPPEVRADNDRFNRPVSHPERYHIPSFHMPVQNPPTEHRAPVASSVYSRATDGISEPYPSFHRRPVASSLYSSATDGTPNPPGAIPALSSLRKLALDDIIEAGPNLYRVEHISDCDCDEAECRLKREPRVNITAAPGHPLYRGRTPQPTSSADPETTDAYEPIPWRTGTRTPTPTGPRNNINTPGPSTNAAATIKRGAVHTAKPIEWLGYDRSSIHVPFDGHFVLPDPTPSLEAAREELTSALTRICREAGLPDPVLPDLRQRPSLAQLRSSVAVSVYGEDGEMEGMEWSEKFKGSEAYPRLMRRLEEFKRKQDEEIEKEGRAGK